LLQWNIIIKKGDFFVPALCQKLPGHRHRDQGNKSYKLDSKLKSERYSRYNNVIPFKIKGTIQSKASKEDNPCGAFLRSAEKGVGYEKIIDGQ